MTMSGLARLDWNPSAHTLRQFGFIALGAFGLLALMAHQEAFMFRAGLGNARLAVTWSLLGVGVLSALFSIVAPRANRPLFVGLSVVAYPIGWVVSHVLLAVLFFGLFAPIGFLLKATGQDTLQPRESSAGTYWQKARRKRAVADYFKQY
jgi:Saxitoxin biosynthesis operon protein SxtJ